jgi:hypothetical protein
VTLPAEELLERIATTLRQDIGPAVSSAYPRTQAFMAAVVVEKLAHQLAVAAAHERADTADLVQLYANLDARLRAASTPPTVRRLVREGVTDSSVANVCRLIEALYAHRGELGPTFDTALGLIRTVLRARVDRQMEYAR